MGLIKSAQELEISAKIKMLIYGQPGMGKTTLGISAPKPLLFDFDNGVHRVNFAHLEGVDTVQITSYKDFLDVIEKEDLSPYETLLIDTGGKCLDFMGMYIIERNPKMGRKTGSLTLQGYGERKGEFTNLIRRVTNMGKHIVFLAHRETKQEGDDTRYIPQFGGSNYDSLVTELDLVGYLEAEGKQRTITFDPTSRNDGKNTCNLPSMMEVPNIINDKGEPTGDNDFVTKIIETYNNRLQELKNNAEDYRAVLDVIDAQVEAITTIEEANDFVANIDKIKHVGNSKAVAGRKIHSKSKELNLSYDKKTKKYVENVSV